MVKPYSDDLRARIGEAVCDGYEHSIIAARRAFLVRSPDDQRRDPLPCCVVQDQPIHHAQDRLPKSSLESRFTPRRNP